MIEERIQILLPKAIDNGQTQISVREFPLTIFCNKNNYFIVAIFDKIEYFPRWANVRVDRLVSGAIAETYTGDNGSIDIGVSINAESQETFALYNESVDTQLRMTLMFRGWQFGET